MKIYRDYLIGGRLIGDAGWRSGAVIQVDGHGKDDGGSMHAWRMPRMIRGLAVGPDKVVSHCQSQYTCPMAIATFNVL